MQADRECRAALQRRPAGRLRTLTVTGSIALAALAAAPASAGPWVIRPVSDLGVAPAAPALDGRRVVMDDNGFFGTLYQFEAGVTTVYDNRTPMPGSSPPVNFSQFDNPWAAGGVTAFGGLNLFASGERGVYDTRGGTLNRTASTTTPLPDRAGTFQGFGLQVATDGVSVVFSGAYEPGVSKTGLYVSRDGQLTTYVDDRTPKPGAPGQTFNNALEPDVEGRQAVFSDGGLYLADGTSVTMVADFTTPLPDRPGVRFGFLTNPLIDQGRVWFKGFGQSGGVGIYRWDQGVLSAVLSADSALPGGGQRLGGVDELSVDDGRWAFLGYALEVLSPGVSVGLAPAIYSDAAGQVDRLIGVDDVLDGKTILGLSFSRDGLDGDALAFGARFTDGSYATYLATVALTPLPLPAPVWLVLGAFAVAWLRPAARRRRA